MLVDTSVWVDHFRNGNRRLQTMLEHTEVHTHPFVIGELACGNLSRRSDVLTLLGRLPRVVPATDDEVLAFVEENRLMGSGVGWVDSHLLAASALNRTTLWSLDAKLSRAARRLRLHAPQ